MQIKDESNTSSLPRVTVILSTYNWSSVLPYSIGSVLRQTFSDWELLVIGDGCTDDSEEVVRRLQHEHSGNQIRWINLPVNTGNQFGPNNEGLRQARGALIAYLGHDDLWLPHHLSSLVTAIDAGSDFAHTIVKWVYLDGQQPYAWLPHQCVSPSSVMHRRSVTESVGGWRNYREIERPPDSDLWNRIREAGYRFAFVPRLSVVKFPATTRRDVYKTRPCHEQAAWSERIKQEPDFEAIELGAMLSTLSQTLYKPPTSLFTEIGNLFFREAPKRLRQKLNGTPTNRKGAQVDAWRKFKGLEQKRF